MSFLSKLLGGKAKVDRRYYQIVEQVNALEGEMQKLLPEGLKAEAEKLKKELAGGASTDEVLPRSFALTREAAKRTLKQRHFDVQVIGGAVLHSGAIAEMRTGEGKTLVATLPVTLNALTGKGSHVVTVNEYLAKRDTVWMGQVYNALGLSVACLTHGGALKYDAAYKGTAVPTDKPENPLKEGGLVDKERDTTGAFMIQDEYLRPISRAEAYACDVTHGTNHEFGFDYLRDNLARTKEYQVQRAPHFAVIDEVDSILIDEARTPLIIAAPDAKSSDYYKQFTRIVSRLEKGVDYEIDEKLRAVQITESGINKVEQMSGVKNLYEGDNLRLTHYLQECLKAHGLFQKDRDYVVKGNEVIIVDQFTGRLMQGRRYSGGLHQAIEAKEGVLVQAESRTYATISIQNYFRLYPKISGMTGTAQTSAEEFHKVYGLEVVTIPTNREMIRDDMPDLVYKNVDAKYNAIIADIKKRNEKGQPVLIGTVSIEKNEELSRRLSMAGLKHEALNAKNNEREGSIIAQAGRKGAITVATNMAGRGVDIILGGNPPKIEEQQAVRDLGGLHVIGTERHESRRIDNQLRGRAGRQGDPGSSQFFLSMEDDLMRIFGGNRMQSIMNRLHIPDDVPITAGMLTRSIGQAQTKVEGHHFDARKHLLEYDDVLNKQRLAIYRRRQEMLETGKITINNRQLTINEGEEAADAKPEKHELILTPYGMSIVLGAFDSFWMNHLEDMEAVQEAVRLRSVGQKDPLVEYRREGHQFFGQMVASFDQWLSENEKKILEQDKQAAAAPAGSDVPKNFETPTEQGDSPTSYSLRAAGSPKVGRNDPCYCGSGKKFKKCHGK